jgi:DNA (cytosine-5)-methyltransferase 1
MAETEGFVLNSMKFGELFSGPGGMALGAHLAATECGVLLEHAWANDYDKTTCETYIRNIPGATKESVSSADVRELDIKSLGPIDGFAFGFPCNDFSQVGEHRGTEGKFGALYKYGVEVLDTFSPDWFIAENVGGLRSSNDGGAFLQILKELSGAGLEGGYTIVPHLYRFEEYGVPQARHRILIVGIRKDLGFEFKVPSRTLFEGVDVSSRSAISSPAISQSAHNHELTRQHPRVVERLQHIKPGKNAFNSDLPEHLRLNVTGATISQIYRRLNPTKPSYTVTGSGGGGTHVYHWAEPRALTNRERARLQTFPDDFIFEGGKENVRRQIGMAVPVQGARVVFDALFKSLQGIPYEFEESNMKEYLLAAGKR